MDRVEVHPGVFVLADAVEIVEQKGDGVTLYTPSKEYVVPYPEGTEFADKAKFTKSIADKLDGKSPTPEPVAETKTVTPAATTTKPAVAVATETTKTS